VNSANVPLACKSFRTGGEKDTRRFIMMYFVLLKHTITFFMFGKGSSTLGLL
jgi:hypothetical protein